MSARTIGAACSFLLFTAAGLSAESIAWNGDLAAAQAEANKTGRVLMVDVYTDWCTWCKKLDSDTYSDSKVIEKARSFVALKLNPERSEGEAKFAEKYGVSGYPTILFLDGDGAVVNRIGGYLDAKPFADAMQKTMENAPKIKGWLAEFQSGKFQNADALLALLLETGRAGEARPVFDRLQKDPQWDGFRRGSAALSIANSLFEREDYKAALDYLKIVEDLKAGTEDTLQARLMHAVALFYLQGKKQTLGYLDAFLKEKNVSAAWKTRIQDLRKQVDAAKEPAKK